MAREHRAMTNTPQEDKELRKTIYKTACDCIHGDGACEQHEEVKLERIESDESN